MIKRVERMRTHASRSRMAGWSTIALVGAVLTVAVYAAWSDRDDAAVAVATTKPISEHLPNELSVLLRFVDAMPVRGDAPIGHELAAAGVRHVAAALATVATSAGLNIDGELETLREYAGNIERDPLPHERTAQARLAFHLLGALLEALQQTRFRGLEPDVANVIRAASSLRADDRLAEQSDVIQEFFRRAASAIRAMNTELSSPRSSRI
jgi:hypothetical protein